MLKSGRDVKKKVCRYIHIGSLCLAWHQRNVPRDRKVKLKPAISVLSAIAER